MEQAAQEQPPLAGATGDDGPRNLWVGDLQYWMDENYIWNCFAHTGEVHAVKVIRNKATGQSEGYGFVEFTTHAAAQNVLQTYNGALMPNTEQPFRINWASFGAIGQPSRPPDNSPEHSIFVGDLAPEVTDQALLDTFRPIYATVKSAKVVTDSVSGRSKGYGFVRFTLEEERDRALTEMNGQYCLSRPMRISVATPKGKGGGGGGGGPAARPYSSASQGEDDPSNTTIFVGGLDSNVTEDQLREVFAPYGDLVYVKIPYGKGCGFVQFQNRPNAESALHSLHGTVVGAQAIRLSWGKNPAAKQRGGGYQQSWQHSHDQSQYASYYGAPAAGAYGAYDASAYTDPNAAYGYAGGYAAAPYAAGYGYPQQQWPAQQGAYPGAPPAGGAGQGPPGGSSGTPPAASAAPFDPTQPPDVDKMNAQYIAAHEASLAPHHLQVKASDIVSASS